MVRRVSIKHTKKSHKTTIWEPSMWLKTNMCSKTRKFDEINWQTLIIDNGFAGDQRPKHAKECLGFLKELRQWSADLQGNVRKNVRKGSGFVRVDVIWVKLEPEIWKCVHYLTKAILLLKPLELRNYYYYYYYYYYYIVWCSNDSFQ